MDILRASQQLYALVLNIYPLRFRREFSEEMQFVFSESLKEAYEEQHGIGVIKVWGRTLIDASKSIAIEHIRSKGEEEVMNTHEPRNTMRNIMFIALGTIGILLIPFLAMQFGAGVDWGLSDFMVAGVLLFGMSLLYELIVRKITDGKQRLAIGIVLLFALLWLWAELAVGLFTSWGS